MADKKFLEGLTALQILGHVYEDTLKKIVFDIQKQVNDCASWKENSSQEGYKLSEKEIFELDKDIKEKTSYVKSLLEYYAGFYHPCDEIHNLCKYYGIKTFRDNFKV